MKRLYKKSLYKIFVSLFVVFYTFVPQGIALGQVIEDYSQENAAPIEEEVIPEESLLQEEVVLPEEDVPPVVEEPLVEEPIIEEPIIEDPIVEQPVVEPEEILKEVISYPVWVINGDTATTYDVVELGKTYIAPQNSMVRVIFTKLPENPSKLTIEEITLTPEEIEATGAVSDKAYDITTDMVNGTFEYDLTLPNIEENTKVVYVEERVDLFTDVKEVTNEIISDSEDTIKIKELDHFTIFFVSATVKISGEVNGSSQVTVTPGGTITVTLEVELGGDEPNDWYSTQYKIGDYSSVCLNNVPDPDINNTGSHTVSFDLSAPTTTGTYDLRLRIYDRSNCDYTNDSNRKEITLPSAIVVANLPPVTNPFLNQACGLDIAIVIDNSTSIDSSEMNQIKNAMTSFTNALNGTPTWFSVTRFATTASVVQTFTSDISAVNAAINAIPVGGGYTNWQDGLTKALSTFSSDRNDIPDLIIFASDGNPNRTGTTGISVNEAQAVADAVVVANQIKGLNIRILTLGVGADLDTPNLVQISGSNVNTGDVLTSDVITTSFTELAAQLYTFASQTCGGTISVNKYYDQVAEASRGGAGWVFDVAGTTRTSDANGQTETVKVDAGIYSVSETNLLPGYSYGSASCYKVASPSHIEIGVDVSNGVGSIPVGNTDIVYCNFINTTNPGSITIIKDAQPNDPQDFSFTTTGTGLTNFTLDDDSNPTLSDTKVFSNLMPGTFTIIEDDISDWSLDSITCSTGGVVDLVNKKATVTLTAGLDVTCTFTNKIQTGHIIIEKQTDPDGSTKSFEFNPSWSDTNFFLIDGQNIDSGALLPGTYSISELEPLGWDSTSSCDDGSTVDNISLQAGEIIKCTFTNIDLIPTILVTKVANPTVVPETGGNVTFTFRVENTSSEEPVTILSLSDTVYTLSGDADCMVGTVLAAGASCEFSITEWVEGDYSGLDHRNVFTAVAEDNDGTDATDDDDATVDFSDVAPTILVTKVANPTVVPESGGDVTFTYVVTNNGPEAGEITVLDDDQFGSLSGDADCYIGKTLVSGESCSFEATFSIPEGIAPATHTNIFTATLEDNEGNTDSDTDNEVISLTPVPSLKLEKIVVNQYGSDASESNWTLYATGDEKGFYYTSDESEFVYVNPEVQYTLTESGPDGFSASDWSCTGGTLEGNVITLSAEDDVVCTITNTALPATVIVYKNVIDWNDNDVYSDQMFEVVLEGEDLSSQNIKDSETDPRIATFGLLDAGVYTPIEINIPNGYISNGCSLVRPVFDDSLILRTLISPYYVGNGETLSFVCENQVIQPELQLIKSNNSNPLGVYPGDYVEFTLEVNLPARTGEYSGTYIVEGVKVTDLIPSGFAYQTGSWSAVSSVRGPLSITNPGYSEGVPGLWNLGDMVEGETVVLKYLTKISLLQDAGLYRDNAWSIGESVLGIGVVGNALSGIFVGTEVLVIEPIEIEEGEVLGASIELPATGAQTYLTLGALISMILGFIILIFNPKRKIKTLFVTSLFMLITMFVVKPIPIYAVESKDIDVRIEQPESPTNENSFKIGYVALDMQGRPVSIQCYMNDVAFGPVYTTNSGNCVVDSTIIPTSGTYTFKVIVTAGTDTKTSSTVPVEIKLEKPSPVTNYLKTEGVCTYTLTFKTANDGRTSKVEIFRSDTQPFTANASTLIKTLTVGPNTDVSYTDTNITDCDKEYYYAIRTLDDLNNFSSFVTDNIIKIVQGTTSTTVTVNGETGEVAGEETTAGEKEEAPNEEGEEGEDNGEVKGDEDKEDGEDKEREGDDTKESFWNKYKYVIIAAGVVVLGSAGYSYVRRKK